MNMKIMLFKSLGKFLPKKNNFQKFYNELKDKIDKFNEFINEIITKINEVAKIMNIYYNIISNHYYIYKNKKKNYQIFQNINDFQKNKIILDDISGIINANDIKNKIDYIFIIYNKIKDKKENIEKTNKNQEEQNKYKQLIESKRMHESDIKSRSLIEKNFEQNKLSYEQKIIELKTKLEDKEKEIIEVKRKYDNEKMNLLNKINRKIIKV